MSESPFAWLVEKRPVHLSPMYLAAETTTDEHLLTGNFEWTSDANRALRFSRRRDASAFIGAMLNMSEHTALKGTLPGLRDGDQYPVVVEHGWSD